MGYAEIAIEWVELTLKALATRLSEEKARTISSEDVVNSIYSVYGFTDNTEVRHKLQEEGLGIYHKIKDQF